MIGALELRHALDNQQIGADARNVGPHGLKHPAQLLDVGFAGGMVQGSGSFSQYRCHDYVGCSGYRGFIEKDVGSTEFPGFHKETSREGFVGKGCAQFFKTQKVGVQPAASDFVASGLGDEAPAAACQKWSDHHDGTPEADGFFLDQRVTQGLRLE